MPGRDRQAVVGFVGAGAVGRALSWAMAAAGYPVAAVASRRLSSAREMARRIPGCHAAATPEEVAADAEVIFLTVPDDAIRAVCEGVRWPPGRWLVHTSGARSVDELESARVCLTAVFHPLQTFALTGGVPRSLAGTTIAVQGGEPLASWLESLAVALEGQPFRLPQGASALYHLAAVLGSNYVVALVAAAAGLWQRFGAGREAGLRALLPLLKGTVSNLERAGLPGALTGPVARGDAGTVRRHLEALAAAAPELLPAYREIGLLALELARERGLDAEGERELRTLLAGSVLEAPARGEPAALPPRRSASSRGDGGHPHRGQRWPR